MSYKFQKGDAKLGGAIEASQLTGTLKPSSLADATTDNIAEGSSLYYTDARVFAAVSAGTGLDYDAAGEFSISDGGVDTTQLAADAVDGTKIADDSVDSEHIAAGAIDFEHFAAGSVSGSALADAGVGNAKLLNSTISGIALGGTLGALSTGNGLSMTSYDGSAAVSDLTITLDGATLSVGGSGLKVADGGVDTTQLAADAVDGTKIADDSVDSEHIALGALDAEHYSSGSVQNGHLAGAIADTKLNTISTADKVAGSAVQLNANGGLFNDSGLALSASVAGDGLAFASGVLSVSVDGSSIELSGDALQVRALGITRAMLEADAVDGTKLADDAVDSEHIAAGAIDFEHFAAGSVSGSALADAGVGNAKLLNDSVTLTAGAGMAAIGEVALGASITVAVDGVLEDLDALGAASADGEFIVATGAGAFAYESGNTARTSLGLGTGDTVTFNTLTASVGIQASLVQGTSVQATTFNGDSLAVTGITGSLNNALSAGDGIADFTYNNGDGPKTVALDLKPDDGLQITSGQLAVKVDSRSFSLTAGNGIELASAVAGEGLSLSSGVLSAVHAVNTTDTNQDFNVAYGVNAQILGMSGAVTASLPQIVSGDEGKVVVIKVSNADAHTVRVQADGSQKIDNSTDDILIESNAGALTLVALGATAGWAII